MSINWQEIAFHFLGGLGLFLYSIKTMGDGLQQAAGDRLRFSSMVLMASSVLCPFSATLDRKSVV